MITGPVNFTKVSSFPFGFSFFPFTQRMEEDRDKGDDSGETDAWVIRSQHHVSSWLSVEKKKFKDQNGLIRRNLNVVIAGDQQLRDEF